MMGYGGGWGWMWSVSSLAMLLFWVALVLAVVWLTRALSPAERRGERDTPLAVLRRRYAAGEITQADFEQVRRALGGAYHAPGEARTGEKARR